MLLQYRQLDDRFTVLTVALRVLAAKCELDQPELGTLPPHTFAIMVLYFMQQNGMLPVLQQVPAADAPADRHNNKNNSHNYLSKSKIYFQKPIYQEMMDYYINYIIY